jgi:(E)-4-hydroxy-3-methylbut-2-enyl-diphosphate synthase
MVYVGGLPSHRLKDSNIVDHLVEMIEKKANELASQPA